MVASFFYFSLTTRLFDYVHLAYNY